METKGTSLFLFNELQEVKVFLHSNRSLFFIVIFFSNKNALFSHLKSVCGATPGAVPASKSDFVLFPVVKKLVDFELLYVSLQSCGMDNCKVGLRKW